MRRFTTVAIMTTVLLVGGCNRSTTAPAQKASALAGRAADCNVLLITLDTTRADRLGCYGWPRAATPALDALARKGVRFERAFAQVPITLPSHAVLLTGGYPAEIGVRDNGRESLPPDVPLLSGLFRERGYRTGAFLASSVLDKRYGLSRGFEVYDDKMVKTPANPLATQIPADMVCDRALTWLDGVKESPFFCWVHFYDPHTPYFPPDEYLKETGDPYDGEVAFMDANVGRLTAWLATNGLAEKTLVVAVADHGESLGEHGYEWHSLLLYDSIMRVPLIFSLPGRLPEGQVSDDTVRTVDIMPTMLDLLSWPTPEQVSGASFAAALAGESMPVRQSYGETEYPYNSFGWSNLRCLVDGNWKYIRAPEPELYDLSADRGELHNLAAAEPEVVDRMEADLAALEAEMTPRESTPVALDSESRRALESLGYVGGAVQPPIDSARLKNPRDMAAVEHDYRLAEGYLASGNIPEAARLIEAALARSPESYALIKLGGMAFARAGQLERGQHFLMRALEFDPNSADVLAELAVAVGMRGRLDRAVELCQRALRVDPAHDRAGEFLAWARDNLARRRAAMDSLGKRLQASPGAPSTSLSLAEMLLASGQPEDAVAVLRAALARSPQAPPVADALAWILATSWQSDLRDGAEALRLARLACNGASNANYYTTLAAAYAEAGQFGEATAAGQKALQLAQAAGDQPAVTRIKSHLKLYEAAQPYHELP